MHAKRPRFQTRWWMWIALLGVGLLALAAGLGLILITLVALAWLTATMLRMASAGAAKEPSQALTTTPTQVNASHLTAASDERLCQLWTQTSDELARSYLPSTIASYAELRQAILDELFRRNPSGLQRWLDDRAEQRKLLSYLHDHHI